MDSVSFAGMLRFTAHGKKSSGSVVARSLSSSALMALFTAGKSTTMSPPPAASA
jgi:hypothetical protein